MSARIRQWIGFVIMLIGLGFLDGPFVIGAYHSGVQAQVVREFYVQQSRPVYVPEPTDSRMPEQTTDGRIQETTAEPLASQPQRVLNAQDQAFYEAAVSYNESLLSGRQEGMNATSDVEVFALDARDYGYTENIVGTIRVPRMEIELGLYLGAGYQNMAKGAAIFGMTSVPLGQGDENCAIAGHRGSSGTAMFRNIQMMQLDDPIYITTPWAELVYRVTGIEIVTPDDNTWCRICPGKTMISLMSCHPYGSVSQRYVVFAELTREQKPEEAEILRRNAETYDPAAKTVTVVHADGSRELTSVDSHSIVADGREYGSVMSNVMIMAEDKMRPVAYAMSAAVAMMGIWLTVQTVRDARRKKGDKSNESQ